ncbi:RluA family pseudouridine synthase [Clostridium algidicarnis]|uniref:Pseudouridine synthase n=1 Tax=Clostridium algidicarnis DSM 15099 TaxID=1121295 RepID=A0A2S6FWH5_9CLOT|nr:RluA family pseudouridine synthase [Clostridium algidicarnis]MBB6697463.1 RluA family pseudouridine synthase [Clostridium algidicarnis]MCB2287148.1 RluA family pseudouridine synthase [Clostridium algidicarnis]PPK47946.1 23S rRNA pseudouridine1911/1915/1917 synthase [Clostridium algidicarnis DSM 15099]
MNNLEFIVEKEAVGLKIRDYLKHHKGLSSRLIRGAAPEGRIKVNGNVVKLNYIIKEGENISVDINKKESQNIEAEDMPLDIVYEDEDVLVVNKPPFMVVHPTRKHNAGTLSNGVIYHFKENKSASVVRLVSRLDMNTSGLIIIAKNQYSHAKLSESMKLPEFKKYYRAVVHGSFENEFGTIDLPIYYPGEEFIKRVVDDRGQQSVTHYKVIKRYAEATLLELLLETGRTHQIRVHLEHMGHPIYGDELYSIYDDSEIIKRQALHAYALEFPHPRTGNIIRLKSDIPEDIKSLMKELKL